MVRSSILLATLASVASVYGITCDVNSKCPASAPCCSQYGECGVGAYCLGGCDPLSSSSLDSCVPAPVCKSKTYTFANIDAVTSKTKYLGDSSTTDWVMDGQAIAYQNTALLTMAPNTVGTVLATSTYMWYGNVKARFKTSRGQGVVTAFILLSDVKDEIDYEFVGVDLGTAQTNYYHQGITNYGNSANVTLSDTFNNYHTYEIKWTPDTITWLVDGQVGRTKKRSDTWNATSNQWAYPQTPARVQLSIWPGGLASNGKGTIDWAGGPIDWNGADIQSNGYYYAQFESVTVDCYNATSAPGTNKGTSYTYNNAAGSNNTVVDGDKKTILKSLLGTGTNMTADYASSAGASASTIAAVPGLTGAGPGTDGQRGDTGSSSSSAAAAATATSGSDGGSGTGNAPASTQTGFDQGMGSTGSSGSTTKSQAGLKVVGGEKGFKGSVFAGLIAMGVLLVL